MRVPTILLAFATLFLFSCSSSIKNSERFPNSLGSSLEPQEDRVASQISLSEREITELILKKSAEQNIEFDSDLVEKATSYLHYKVSSQKQANYATVFFDQEREQLKKSDTEAACVSIGIGAGVIAGLKLKGYVCYGAKIGFYLAYFKVPGEILGVFFSAQAVGMFFVKPEGKVTGTYTCSGGEAGYMVHYSGNECRKWEDGKYEQGVAVEGLGIGGGLLAEFRVEISIVDL